MSHPDPLLKYSTRNFSRNEIVYLFSLRQALGLGDGDWKGGEGKERFASTGSNSGGGI